MKTTMPDLQIPYSKSVIFSVGSSMKIVGKPNNIFRLEPQMQVDFHCGSNENSNIAFSFKVIFGKCVVMNSLQKDGWGSEEMSYEVLFVEDQPFELLISAQQNKYQVSVNGEYLFSFAYRIPLTAVQMIQVWRDIHLDVFNVVEKA